MHRRHEHDAFVHAAGLDDRRDFVGDADEFLLLLRVENQIVGMDEHRDHAAAEAGHYDRISAASAFRSIDAVMPARNFRSPAAAIIAALSVDSARLGRNVGISRRCAALHELGAQAAVRRHAAGDADALRLIAPRRVEQPLDQRRRRRRAESWRRCRRSPARDSVAVVRAHVAQHRRLQAAEAEVEIALQLRRIPIRMRQPRRRQRDRAIVAGLRPADRSPARPDSRARAASPPCRTPRPPHRRACG